MKDVVGGLAIIAFALLFLIPGLGYGVGSMSQPGSGGLPVVAAVAMILLGLGIGASGFIRRGDEGQAVSINMSRVRHITFVGVAVIGFAFAIESLGLIPATVFAVVVSSLADPRSRILPTLVLAGFMILIIWLIFKVGLSSTAPLFVRPF
ncbi:tripartite tricarboxylate transporter TctB family protein [Pelagibacterium lacus]|uniref:Tripartite tricarboxylate transporter TctB family protein n=1 Tax=Pelagibacterium lacus TaxID=2282655 RepID=A0A369W4Q6_9HYPH|nr:tripartite tricarboxylate transporter TctB family protein [Pelagibacterium lacus]RDE09676.1 tripartite tricarboxylate transporter TctB family protein [Pelagibacterium lacus]